MPGCVLRIGGTEFAVDDFLRNSCFAPTAVYRRGEPRGSREWKHSGFNVLAAAEPDDIAAQSEEAVRFVRSHRAEIARAHAFPGVEYLVLDFSTTFRDVIVQSERFPAAVVSEAGAAGLAIELTLYPRGT